MRHFLFATAEGYTFQPNSDFLESEMDNLQILDNVSAESIEEAKILFLKDNSFLEKLNFDNVLIYELANNNPVSSFSLTEKYDK